MGLRRHDGACPSTCRSGEGQFVLAERVGGGMVFGMKTFAWIASISISCFTGQHLWAGPDKAHTALPSEFAEFVEPGFPYFSSTFDARGFGEQAAANNLTPRAIILDLGQGVHAAFDTDLLRFALVWKQGKDGDWLTMNSMASGSYRVPSKKSGSGQKHLPKPMGEALLANGIYPGWTVGEKQAVLKDPRAMTPNLYQGQDDVGKKGEQVPREMGLGPLPIEMGRWGGVRLVKGGVILEYEVAGVKVQERVAATADGKGLISEWTVAPHQKAFLRVLGIKDGKAIAHVIEPADKEEVTTFVQAFGAEKPAASTLPKIEKWSDATWKEGIVVKAKLSDKKDAYVIDSIPLPVPNRWKRNVRIGALGFFSDGRMAVASFDGDVWLVSGAKGDMEQVKWKRYASGLHEPQGLQVVDDVVYVSDRNGIVRLHDEDGDGQVDFYENFSNVVAQSAETREFAMDLAAKPGGGFIVAKGGQVGTTIGKYNGSVIEISADGRSFKVLGRGLRQPYIGCDPVSGMVTASDQQGNWVPATPLHVIEKANHYGFLPEVLKKPVHPKKITPPAVWLPHFVNQSGASQVWTRKAKMGPLNDSLIHIGYSRPEIFKIYIDDQPGGPRQGAVSSVVSGFSSATMKGAVNPEDGLLFTCGFKIWGTVAGDVSGLHRVRYTGAPSYVPTEVRSSDKGILLRFDVELERDIATSLFSYTVDSWHYIRTKDYGSGNYKKNGEPGQDGMPVANVYLSEDRKAVFLAIPEMKPVQSMAVTYRVAAKSDLPMIRSAYLTVHALKKIDLKKEGFGDLKPDMTLKKGAGMTMKTPDPTIEEGKKIYQMFGCMACHTVDGSAVKVVAEGQAVGPTWKGLWGIRREFTDGTVLKKVDAAYIKESILDPSRHVVKGFGEKGEGMPPYLGVLKDYQIKSIILYIESLGAKKGKKK
ncbi:MAG: c-type cytochrome [Verrucomicrobiales bacterium]|nr:c-type cytochrome [Verrucomicrobiales bacterium]